MLMSHMKALEVRARWLRYASGFKGTEDGVRADDAYQQAMKTYAHSLGEGETFFMNQRFCELVDFARETVPDDLEFDSSWMVTSSGFIYLEKPFKCPTPTSFVSDAVMAGVPVPDLSIRAVSWFPIKLQESGVPGVYFMCYLAHDDVGLHRINQGFGCWSYFGVTAGLKLMDKERVYESMAGVGRYAAEQLHRQVFIEAYVKGPTDKPIKPAVPVLYKAVR